MGFLCRFHSVHRQLCIDRGKLILIGMTFLGELSVVISHAYESADFLEDRVVSAIIQCGDDIRDTFDIEIRRWQQVDDCGHEACLLEVAMGIDEAGEECFPL